MFHRFFSSLARFRYLSLFLLFFHFYPVTWWNGKVCYSAGSLFLLTITRSGFLDEIRSSVCISKFQRILCVSFSRMHSGLRIHHLFVWSNLNFLPNFQWIIFLIQSYYDDICIVSLLWQFLFMWSWSLNYTHSDQYQQTAYSNMMSTECNEWSNSKHSLITWHIS